MTEESDKETKNNESQEGLKKKLEEELKKIDVKDMVIQMMATLASLGNQKLGLSKESDSEAKELNQVRLAIDCMAALIEASEPSLSQEEASALKNTLANLRMSYVSQSKQ